MQPNALASPPAQRILRIAVIGDPHFVQAEHVLAKGSHLKFDSNGEFTPKDSSQHPWASLIDLVRTDPLANKADIVVCVGDLSSGGDQLALETGWKHLNELAELMGAQLMACTTGNHDVHSRSSAKETLTNPVRNLGNSRGPHEALKCLTPPYPVVAPESVIGKSADDLSTQYFGKNVILLTTPDYRLVVLNSCGEHTSDNIDYEKGSFPKSTQIALKRALDASPDPKLNILVCHHPPASHGHHGENSYDFISGGCDLLTALEGHGSWLVVHGHKHHGHLSYAPGGSRSPVVFAAGSIGATLTQTGNGFRNQFYLIELESADEEIRGLVRAWDWNSGLGYRQSGRKYGGIFDGCGFGLRRSPNEIAAMIANALSNSLPMSGDDLRKMVPEMAYVMPSEYPLVEAALRRRHSISIEPDSQENWNIFARATP